MSDFSDSLRKFGDDVKRKVGALPKTVSFPDLFNPAFMKKYTSVPTIENLFEVGGFEVNSPEDFAAIPDEAWEANVRAHTTFKSWEEMQKVAGDEFLKEKLRFSK